MADKCPDNAQNIHGEAEDLLHWAGNFHDRVDEVQGKTFDQNICLCMITSIHWLVGVEISYLLPGNVFGGIWPVGEARVNTLTMICGSRARVALMT